MLYFRSNLELSGVFLLSIKSGGVCFIVFVLEDPEVSLLPFLLFPFVYFNALIVNKFL